MTETIESTVVPTHDGILGRLRRRVPGRTGAAAAVALWVLAILNFNTYRLYGKDAVVQFTFLRRLFGEDVHAVGYQFGFALVEAPLYALGKGFHALGWTTLAGQPIAPAMISVGIGLLVLVAGWAMYRLLRDLRLPHPALALSAAAFGTPLFYYAVYLPGKTHATDAALIAFSIVLLHRYFRQDRRTLLLPVAMGVLFGFSMTVRYFNGPAAVAVVAGLVVLRRYRDAALVGAVSAATCGLLFILPVALHAPVFANAYDPNSQLTFRIWNVPKMLFTDHRGMFIWSPVALLGLIGYVRLLVVRKADRPFLAIAGSMGLLIVLAYEFIPFWDGTYAFGQRFFTPLAALIAIGLCGFIEWRPRLGAAAALVAAAWMTFLLFNLEVVGGPRYSGATIQGGASDLAADPFTSHTSPGAYVYGVYHRSEIRVFVPYPFNRH